MKVTIEKDQKTLEVEFDGTVLGLLDKLKINKETVIVVRDNEILEENVELGNNDNIKILSVVSGG